MVVYENGIENIKKYLLESNNHFGGAKFSSLIRPLSSDERTLLFSDEQIFFKICSIKDYEVLASVFRVAPMSIQEKMWNQENVQKILLGIGTNVSDFELSEIIKNKKFFSFNDLTKKNKKGTFYYSASKLRALEVLTRYIKSPLIKEQLVYNKYFQMIILCSKKVPESFLSIVDPIKLFSEVGSGDIYKLVDGKTKSSFCIYINNSTSKLLLPNDYKSVFLPTINYNDWFYTSEGTLGSMLHGKIYSLAQKGLKFEVDSSILKLLNLQEINVLKSDKNGVVPQEKIDLELNKIVDNGLEDGTIFSKQYFDTSNLQIKVQCTIFKIVIGKSMNNPKYESKLLEYLFSILFKDEYNELEKKAIMISLKNVLLYANEKMLTDLFLIPNDLKSMFFLRFNLTARNMNYLEGISVSQLMRINVKHINKIVQLFPRTEQDEISDIYAKAIKLYLVFGLSNTTILLNSNYPINKLFMDNVSKLDVSKVNLKVEGKKYIPVYHEDFNRFLFVANNVDALFDDETALSSGWYYLYNNFETIKDLCKGHVTLSQAETILKEQVNTVRYDLEPDCYRLEKLLYEAGLGNKTRNSNEEIYDEMCKIHRQQVKRVISTIPYVSGTLDSGWSYEVMRHDDAVAFVLGYRADCCIRTKDIAHNHLLHALLCENGRILLTYKPDGTIASFSPLKRNGEVIIANSIEAIDKSESVKFDMIEAFSMGMKEICKQTKLNEEKGYLKVATIGTNSVRKPEGTSWPLKIPTPTIYEKKDPVYCDTDTYHKSQTIFYMDEKVNLEGLKYGKSNAKYYDPRGKISSCLSNSDDILLLFKMEKKINGIRYTKWVLEENDKKYFRKTVLRHSIASFCNDDWYIILNYGGEIEYDCLDDDPRARLEMECVLKIVRQYINKNEDIKKLVLDYNEKRLND